MADDDLQRLDRALLRLRRMWDAPAGIPHEGRIVEGSTLLVCLAVEERAHPDGLGEVGVVEVSESLGVTHSTASRLVSRAVDAGMVARSASRSDPRRTSLALTEDGRRLAEASRAFRSARLGAALAEWPAQDIATLADLMSRFASAEVDDPSPRPR